jgi:hypothetical protein
LTNLWSIKLFATAIGTPPELNFGRGVFHSDLQTLHHHQDGMHTQYLTNEEDIEFRNVLSAKQMPGKSLEAKHIGRLGSLPQFHLGSNWDKECSIVLYNPCATTLLTCTI